VNKGPNLKRRTSIVAGNGETRDLHNYDGHSSFHPEFHNAANAIFANGQQLPDPNGSYTYRSPAADSLSCIPRASKAQIDVTDCHSVRGRRSNC
jgi:hypothetical protein